MSFRIRGLDPAPFRPLFGMSTAELAARGIERHTATRSPGMPDRISLCDTPVGATALLLNHTHQPANTPYRASHAIFVHEGATSAYDGCDEIPPALRIRILSLRAFDRDHHMIDADLAALDQIAPRIEQFWREPNISYLQAHYAKHGCYAARIDRA